MEILGLSVLVIIIFWGTINNVRKASEVATLGLKAEGITFTTDRAKDITEEHLEIIAQLRKL